MHKDVKDFVSKCLSCQQTKYIPRLPLGLLQPIPPPSGIWEDTAMDFMVGMPTYQGQTVILVVIDQFSKAAHFRSLTTHFSTCKTVEVFMQMNCNTLGTLRVLSPTETRFSSANFRKHFFRSMVQSSELILHITHKLMGKQKF